MNNRKDLSIPKLPTGVPGLDDLLFGGIPEGRATLISGRSGSCKTVLALQLTASFARAGKHVLFVTAEESPSDLLRAGDQLGFELSQLREAGSISVLDFVPPYDGPLIITGSFDIAGLLHRVNHLMVSNESSVVVIDSVSALFAQVVGGPPNLRHLFFRLVQTLRRTGATIVLTAESSSDYGSIAELGFEDFVCDAVIQLRNVIDGKRRRRTIEVHKYRRSHHLKGEYPCALTQIGLSVFPLDASSETLHEGSETIERYSSGVAGLDAMTGGGWLRDSILLVRGPTGSGKTLLSGHFALAGAERGERVFYYGFEETRTILLRNFARVGLPIRDHVDPAGSLKVISRFPESTSPEDMIIELRQVLREYEPTLIVLDSISAIEHVLSYESFRQFIIGVTSALRQHGRSALLVQAAAATEAVDLNAPYLSTMADAILALSYGSEGDGPISRRIRVLKMRGSAHDTHARELELSADGVTIHVPAPPKYISP